MQTRNLDYRLRRNDITGIHYVRIDCHHTRKEPIFENSGADIRENSPLVLTIQCIQLNRIFDFLNLKKYFIFFSWILTKFSCSSSMDNRFPTENPFFYMTSLQARQLDLFKSLNISMGFLSFCILFLPPFSI